MRRLSPPDQTISLSIGFSVLFILLLSSCIDQVHNNIKTTPFISKKNIYPDIGQYNNDLSEELAENEKILTESSDRETLAPAYLRLASLYSSHRNPSPDYARALKLLNDYSALEPEKAKTEPFQYWYSILSYLNRLRQQYTSLQKENAELKEVLEQLKHLDIGIEERRKQVK